MLHAETGLHRVAFRAGLAWPEAYSGCGRPGGYGEPVSSAVASELSTTRLLA
jgi:hypothetical protein